MDKNTITSNDVRHLYTESYFLNDATGHDEFRNFNGKSDELIEKFQKIIYFLDLHTSNNLLDIGCGRGEIVILHSLNGGDATGVDFSSDAIKLAQEKARDLKTDCKFIISSFENLSEETKYDRIVSNDFIEHISAEEGKLFFKKCFNLLKIDGKLVVYTYPNTIRRKYGYKLIRFFSIIKMRPLPKREPDTISQHYKEYHLNEQSYFSLRKMAKESKFKRVRVDYLDQSIKESRLKSILIHTPLRHLFSKGLILIAEK